MMLKSVDMTYGQSDDDLTSEQGSLVSNPE